MLEQIADLVKQHGQDTVINNPDISNEVNNDILAEATHTITGGLQNMLAGGGLQDVLSLFTGGGSVDNTGNNQSGGMAGLLKNPMVLMMVGHLISKLVGKFNMSPEKASNVSNSIIPNVLNDLVNRTKDNNPSNDSFDLNDLIGSLTGGNTATTESGNNSHGFNFQNLLNQFTGNSNTGNSGFNLQDIISKITSGAQQNQAKQAGGGGGLMDLIKGFMSN